jgi:hypothetical protein
MSVSENRREDEVAETGVTPYERIPELRNFYASGMAVHSNIIEVEPKKKMSAAKTLFVLPFVTSIEGGGVEIPDIQPQEVFYDAYLRFKGNSMAEFQDSMHFKKIHVEKKLQEIETAQRRTAGLIAAEEDLTVEGENAEEALDKEYDKAYAGIGEFAGGQANN